MQALDTRRFNEIGDELNRIGVGTRGLGPTGLCYLVDIAHATVTLWDDWEEWWHIDFDAALRALQGCQDATGDALADYETFCEAMRLVTKGDRNEAH